ncbi:MAG: N-acetyl-gamma-glutamyl-phosphate reductase [Alphaproteobacteria bacterium]|nr:N-acetyl-gamma-glutamyl-phosphate reductase [Alphaproteobacteria bacterium]
MHNEKINVAILGASGYTGAELFRLLSHHPYVNLVYLTGEKHANQYIEELFPHFRLINKSFKLIKIEEIDWLKIDLVFSALPHGLIQKIINEIPEKIKIIDLSSDFRLNDSYIYEQWYHHKHEAKEFLSNAVYGLTEINHKYIPSARLIANPGCYPTASLLPLIPLLYSKKIDPKNIIIDAKSGVSGAGREAKQTSLFTEISEGIHPYGISKHRHIPEIEQELSKAFGEKIQISFTPHLIPMNRGIYTTIYVQNAPSITSSDIDKELNNFYKKNEFVVVLPYNSVPSTRHVRGSNYCYISVCEDRVTNRTIILTVIDNLIKGASGQAIQNMNLTYNFKENLGLEAYPLFP